MPTLRSDVQILNTPVNEQQEAIKLACLMEPILELHDAHVALTGGILYKNGSRKDWDFIIYRHHFPKNHEKREGSLDQDAIIAALATLGIEERLNMWRVVKCVYGGKPVDIIFIDQEEGEYDEIEESGG